MNICNSNIKLIEKKSIGTKPATVNNNCAKTKINSRPNSSEFINGITKIDFYFVFGIA